MNKHAGGAATRLLPRALACAVLLLGFAWTGAVAARAARPTITVSDAGKTIPLRVGATATLRVPARAQGRAVASGRAVLVVPVASISGRRFREWELRAVRVGASVVTAPRVGGGRFRVTIRVRAR